MKTPAYLLFAILAACATSAPAPPPTKQVIVVDTIHGVDIADPFRWLEDQDSAETRAWIAAQNAYAEQVVDDTALIASLSARVGELVDLESIGSPRRAGDYEYFAMRRQGEGLATIYRRPAPIGDDEGGPTADGEYEVVLDPLLLDPAQRKRVHVQTISEDGRLMVYAIQLGGADELELHVRDLEKGEDLPEVFPVALYDDTGIFFEDEGSEAFYYVRRSRKDGPRLYRHLIGTDPSADEVVWGEDLESTNFLEVATLDDGRAFLFTVHFAWTRNELWLMERSTGEVHPIAGGVEALFYDITEWTGDEEVFPAGTLIVRTDHDAPNYRLVAIDPDRSHPDHWRTVIPELADVLMAYTEIEGRYYASYLKDVSACIRIFDFDGTPAGEVAVPEHFDASIRDAPGDSTAHLTLESFASPRTEYLVHLDTGEREVSEPARVTFATDQYTVKQVHFLSKDGTEVPMHIVHRKGLELDGEQRTLLYGYGGFSSALPPRFASWAALWLEHGGVYAVANTRGGIEFGERWHRDGMLENKQNVFDDFIGAAEWLIANDYTSSERLAIFGGSNGGLLVGAALTQRPDLFRAVVCEFPDLDMVRLNQFTESNNVPALLEYGDAADPVQFEFLRQHSPYQNVRDGVDYPAVMFITGDLDTRAPPQQARKMAASLQAASRSGLPVVLRDDPIAGHSHGRGWPMGRQVRERAITLAFLLMQLENDSPAH